PPSPKARPPTPRRRAPSPVEIRSNLACRLLPAAARRGQWPLHADSLTRRHTVNPKRLLLCLVAVAGLAGVAYVAREDDRPAETMASAADKFLAGLDDKQKTRATFDFDDKERTRWFFTPQQQ